MLKAKTQTQSQSLINDDIRYLGSREDQDATEPRAPIDQGDSILPLSVSQLSYEQAARRLIDEVSFRLDEGPVAVVLGHNGAGKSLLLRLCHGLIEPTSGTVLWAGRSPSSQRPAHAMVFQQPVLMRRSVSANLHHALALQGVPWRERRFLAREALAECGLTHLEQRAARTLSGGEQQRLAIARALALRPKAILLDEPTSNLDPVATRAVEDLVRAVSENGIKVIMTTHDLTQARRIAGEVLFMHNGRLLEHTSADEFFVAPDCPEASAFIEGHLV